LRAHEELQEHSIRPIFADHVDKIHCDLTISNEVLVLLEPTALPVEERLMFEVGG
jgi:hypothetical protein